MFVCLKSTVLDWTFKWGKKEVWPPFFSDKMQLYKHACMSASTFKAAKHSFATCIYVIQPHFKLAVTNRNHCCRITWSINTLKLVFNHPTETSKKWVRVPLINLLLIMINVTLSWTKWPYAVCIHLTQTESVLCIYVCT